MMDDAIVPVSLKLPAGLVRAIDAAASAGDRSRTATVRRVLVQAFADDSALRADAAQRFESLQNLPVERHSAGRSGAAVAPAAAPALRFSPVAPAGAADIPFSKDIHMPSTTHESRRAAAMEQAARDDAFLRGRAMTNPHQRPTSGAVDTATTAPAQSDAKSERARLAKFHSRPAPKG